MTRADRLLAFVRDHSGRPIVWGRDDCSAWARRWVEAETGLRVPFPIYASHAEAAALITEAGGLAPLWREALAPLGLVETVHPLAGDVGVVATADHGAVGTIFSGGGWAYWRALDGVTALRPRPRTILVAWTLP